MGAAFIESHNWPFPISWSLLFTNKYTHKYKPFNRRTNMRFFSVCVFENRAELSENEFKKKS